MDGITWGVCTVDIDPVFAYSLTFEVIVGSVVVTHVQVSEGFEVHNVFF